jgi:hypothetical protein
MSHRSRRSRSAGVSLWFAPQRRRTRRRHERDADLPAWITGPLVLVGLVFALLTAASWTLEYLPGLITAPSRYPLDTVSLALALAAPIVVAVGAVLAYSWVRRRRRSSGAPGGPPRPVALSREPIPAGLRFAVLRRDGFRCAYCGRGEPDGVRLHIDHLEPVARGGRTDLDNLVTACADCNLGKSASNLLGNADG